MHCSIMNVLKPLWIKQLVSFTYANIEGRGIHACKKYIEKVINRYNKRGINVYYLQFDITKFYYNISHKILKSKLARKIKDPKVLNILFELINSYKYEGEYKDVHEDCGLPLGNYPSGYECNIYLDSFDRWLKEELKCKEVIRYADDILIFDEDKEFLHKVLICSKLYLKNVLYLKIKDNYIICPLNKVPINFIGYTFYKNHTNIRKNIKRALYKCVNNYNKNKTSLSKFKRIFSSYYGWLSNADCKYFLNQILKRVT